MTTYFCKCGKKVSKSTDSGTTGNRFDNFNENHECWGCPFVYSVPDYNGQYDKETKTFPIKCHECRMSQAIKYASYCQGLRGSDFNSASVYSLDIEFLNQVADEANSLEGIECAVKVTLDRPTEYSTDGLYRLVITCTKNKKGKAAKQFLRDKFFNEDSRRLDLTPAQEKEKVLQTIENAKISAKQGEHMTQETTNGIAALPNIAFENALGALPSFDYESLDETTSTQLHDLQQRAIEAKQNYLFVMADVVGKAHKLLCDTVVAQCDNGKFTNKENTFCAWCTSISIGKDTAYRLLQVSTLIEASTDEELSVLEQAPATLLYSAAAKNAPQELVQAVKSGDITTNAEYQRLKKELEDERAQRIAAENDNDELEAVLQCKSESKMEAINARNKALMELEQAECKIKQLESRPIDIAVQPADPADIERLAEEKAKELIKDFAAETDRVKQLYYTTQNEKEQLKQQLSEAEDRLFYSNEPAQAGDFETACSLAADIGSYFDNFYKMLSMAMNGIDRGSAASVMCILKENIDNFRTKIVAFESYATQEVFDID